MLPRPRGGLYGTSDRASRTLAADGARYLGFTVILSFLLMIWAVVRYGCSSKRLATAPISSADGPSAWAKRARRSTYGR
jgi:hypothetical protein